ncbi:protein kinase domain-containing protein [Sandarakinorhabdus sp. DWP1-3-1]|uniref:serine/threonine-protein kinase n=1 Tax=Sandarakinorhabdus sp. DWP1-3-1 TaxID=2804627 RepID=UPI003CE832A2
MADAALDARALPLLDAALALPPDARDAFITDATGDDPALAARLRRLLAASDESRLRTGSAAAAVTDAPMPDRIGRYRITRLIGVGGMGAVYRGERDTGDFDHVVAIKLIRPGALSDVFIERFARERQTLARLSHPHIARLFDGGETPAGEPYIVMEHVDGIRLDEWLASGPSIAARTALFLDVCSAVGFAHQNLIIHRDLTPANILVDRDGNARLIDFGIARPPLATPPDRVPGVVARSLTPGFAAPERIAGDPATTLSDVYSLGVLLALMLPDESDRGDRDLAAIIARARAAEPQARYASVDALAADVRAWQAGDVVAARNGGRRYRIGRFVARHRIGVAAGTAAVVLLVGALGTTLAANARAETARVEAEQRFAQTRAIARSLLFDAYDEVGKVPGSAVARARLAETGQTYLLALAAQKDAPRDVRIETGLGFLRLAKVVGNGGDNQLGRLEDGSKLIGRADAILAPLHRAYPDDPAVTIAYADLLVEQTATALYTDNDPATARRKALEARRLLGADPARSVDSARLYALAAQGLGDSYAWSDDYAAARTEYRAAEAFITGLPPGIADARPLRMVRSANLRLLAEANHKLGDETAALAAVNQAVALNRALVAAAPDDPALPRKLALSLWYRAVLQRTDDHLADAAASIAEAVAIARALRQRSNGDASSLQLVAFTGEVQAQVLIDLGRAAEAFAISDEVVAAHRRMVTLAGDTDGPRRSMAMALTTVGGNFYTGGARGRACAAWQEALALLEGNRNLGGEDRAKAVPRLRAGIAQCVAGAKVTVFEDL